MKIASGRNFVVLQLCCALLISACGLATSNEERIARAITQMDAGEYRAAMIDLKNVLTSDADNVMARTLLAEVSLGLGDVLAAEKELARAAELEAAETTVLPLHLRILLARRDYIAALTALGLATEALTDEQQWSFRGQALLGLGNAEAAGETYNEWLKSDPASPDAAIGLAIANAATGKLSPAIQRLQGVVQRNPGNYLAWHSLGVIQFRAGDYTAAEKSLINAVDNINPQSDMIRYADILASLTETELVLAKPDAARRNLDRLLGVAPNSPSSMFLAARLARTEDDYALASRYLQSLLNVSPDNSAAQLFLAHMQMMQGNFAQAESLLQRVVAMAPDNLQARKLLAQVQLQQSQPGGAIEVLAPLLDGESEDADLYTILAQASLQQGDPEEAIRRFRTATELAPGDMEAKLNLVSAYLDANEIALAMEILDAVPEGSGVLHRRERLLMVALVISERPDEADAVASKLLAENEFQVLASTVVADHYLRTDRGEVARQVLRELVAARPEELGARNALARTELAEGNSDIAHKLFSAVIDKDRNNLVALVGLARVADLAGDKARMIALLVQAVDAHESALGARVMLARGYRSEDRNNDAEKIANELVAIGFHNSHISVVVGDIFAVVGRTEEALSQYRQAALLKPLSPPIQLGLARTYLTLERTVEAREALNKALDIAPGWPPAMTLLVLVEIRQGQLDDARRLVAEFRSLHPDSVTGMVLEGEVLLYQQEFVLAAQAFRRAVESGAGRSAVLREYQALVDGIQPQPEVTLERWLLGNPEDAVTRTFLAQHYQVSRRADEAIREYEKVLHYRPDDANVLNNLAWQYQQNDDHQHALELAEKAYDINPDSGSIADTLGWIYYDLGQLKKSLELLGDASRLSPANGEIQFHLAVALSDSGDKEMARRVLERLKDRNAQFPSRDRADALLGQL